jgi:hypothetical protein
MEYGKLLSRAWKIVWDHKFMFLLGFLAALGGGSGGGGTGRGTSNMTTYQFDDLDVFAGQVGDFMAEYWPLLVGVGLVVLILGIVFWLLRLTAEAGMIEAANVLDEGQEMTFGQSFSAGSKHLGRLVGLSLTLYGPLILVGLIMGFVGLFSTITAVSGNGSGPIAVLAVFAVCLVPLACILALYALVVNFIYPFAQRGIILGRYGVLDGARHGWRVLVDNIVDIIVLALIFLVLNFLVGAVVAVIALPVGAASLFPAFMRLAQDASVGAGSIILAVLGVALIGLLAGVVSSIVRAYQSTTFTLAYKEFTGLTAPEADDDLSEALSA